jgi:hypothetical protein
MPKIGELHTHTMSDAPPESSLTYWRVQVSLEGGAVETLVFTESDIQKARARLAKHPADAVPMPAPASKWSQVRDILFRA